MIKYYTYVEPTSPEDMTPMYFTFSEDEIVKMHWDYFLDKIRRMGLNPNNYSKFDCIEDWVGTHWALESL